MAARALLKSNCERGWSSSIFRTMQRELSSSAISDLAPFTEGHSSSVLLLKFPHAALTSPSQRVPGTRPSIQSGGKLFDSLFFLSSRGSSFSQDVRWMGSRQDMLIRTKVNDLGRKKSTWTCPKCGSVNGARHQKCMGCQEPDSIAIGRSPSFGFALGVDSETTSRVGLPRSIAKFCVLRSPHIDKKSREQFEMRINKLYMVVKTRSEDLQKKFFWLKRQRILGAQYEIVFSYKTRLPLKPPTAG